MAPHPPCSASLPPSLAAPARQTAAAAGRARRRNPRTRWGLAWRYVCHAPACLLLLLGHAENKKRASLLCAVRFPNTLRLHGCVALLQWHSMPEGPCRRSDGHVPNGMLLGSATHLTKQFNYTSLLCTLVLTPLNLALLHCSVWLKPSGVAALGPTAVAATAASATSCLILWECANR